ncbi:MAG: TatD family hydrolase [Bacteroidaceae bacterium]
MLNLHTHNLSATGDVIINLPLEAMLHPETFSLRPNAHYSAGIHPWYLDHSEQQLEALHYWLTQKQIVAIGECGLDKTCKSPFAAQQSLFEQQLQIAVEHQKPVILHCVHAFDALLRIVKPLLCAEAPRLTHCIVHGFRGKPALATQLLAAGLSLSFGEHFNEGSVRSCPTQRLFIETDESALSIEEIAHRIACCQAQ